MLNPEIPHSKVDTTGHLALASLEKQTKPKIKFNKAQRGNFTFESQFNGRAHSSGEVNISEDGEEGVVVWFGVDNPEVMGRGGGQKSYQSLIDTILKRWPKLKFIEGTTFNPKMLKIVINTEIPEGWDKSYWLGTTYHGVDDGSRVDPEVALDYLQEDQGTITHIFERIK